MLVENLGSKYGETLAFVAQIMTPNGPRPMEFYTNPATHTWTALTLRPESTIACIGAVGEQWMAVEQHPAGRNT